MHNIKILFPPNIKHLFKQQFAVYKLKKKMPFIKLTMQKGYVNLNQNLELQ